jgi:hypothetical protein
MANAATVLNASMPIGWENCQYAIKTSAIKLTFDTINTDLTIYTPSAENYVAITGLSIAEATAGNLTFTSGSTVINVLELPANYALIHKLGEGVLLTTIAAGDALKIQTSALLTTALIYVQEFKYLRF